VRLFLIRHGETDHNAARRIQGPLLDDSLNARGRLQAEALAAHFGRERAEGLRLAAVYASPLKRAWETAEALARGAAVPTVAPLPAMIEYSWGIFLGRKEDEVLPHMHEVHEQWEKGNVDHAPPQGESPRSAWERARQGLAAIYDRHRADDVAIVAHGRINKIILAAMVAQDLSKMDAYGQGNTSITLLEQTPSAPFDAAWRMHYVNRKDHLDGVVATSGGTQAEGEPPLV
jgi:broad specificity phosphatase PhoE